MIYSNILLLAETLKNKKIGVSCCDAGAANIIFKMLEVLNIVDFVVCLDGPAIQICNKYFQEKINYSKSQFFANINFLLTGTSWSSNLENEVRKIAHRKGIQSVVALDHWTNYKNRFYYKNEYILPSEIWVFDEYAFKIAQGDFLNITVKLYKNFYMENEINIIKNFENKNKTKKFKIVYILEPIRKKWLDNETVSGEFQALDYFIKNMSALEINFDSHLILRLHPSENKAKYTRWLNKTCFSKKELVNSTTPIEKQLSDADIVLGCESNLLVIALFAGKKVVSTLPPWAPECILPHKGLLKLKNMVGVKS